MATATRTRATVVVEEVELEKRSKAPEGAAEGAVGGGNSGYPLAPAP